MDRRGWYVVAATVVIGIESTANASSQSAGRMTAHLVNYAGVPANDVNEAQREAAEIYAAAGIELLWVLGNQEDHPTVGVDVRVVLLDRVMSAKTINEGHLGEDVLGVGGQAGWAYVFVHRVTLRSLSAHACFSRVLGRVVAHEIGRVLLPFSQPYAERHHATERRHAASGRPLFHADTERDPSENADRRALRT
jgi:hypothetical protein